MGLYFIVSGARRGEPGIIATLQEHPTQLERVAQGFGWNTGVLVVTCNPGTAHANLYIHRRCSSRGSRCSKIRAALQETVAAAGGDASPDLRRAVTSVWDKDFRQSRL